MNIKMTSLAIVVIVSAAFCTSLNAQDRNEVIAAYNEGAKTMQTDVPAAIASFEKVVTLSDKVGETANDLKEKAVKVLPGLYVKAASKALSEKKPGAEVVRAAKDAVAASEKYNNAASKENAGKLLVQGYYTMGNQYFIAKDFDNALLAFDSVLTVNPNYAPAFYNKALVYRSQNNPAAFEQSIDQFLEKVKAENDAAKVKQGSVLALEYFRAAGSQANQAGKLDEAITMLDKAAKYGDDKDLFYYYADVYNKQKNFDKGAEFAQKGLDLETGTADAKAKFYFQLGLAQEGKGDNAKACESFKNSMFGAFAEPSKVERKNLKCL